MPSNLSARLDYESGVTAFEMHALTDSGDHIEFTSSAERFSELSGNAPDIKPNGLLTGGAVIPAVAAGNNNVDVATLTCNLNGVETTVVADTDVAITRPATAVSKVNSITVNAAGAIAVVAGTDGATTAFSATRGAAGGPPYIPVDSIEIAQVRVISDIAAVINAAQIYQTVGTHQERADFPVYTADNPTGTVSFDSALPLIHTGDVAKKVYAEYAEPVFSEAVDAYDFVPAETTHSTGSTQVYNRTIGSSASSLNQASFNIILRDGITDNLLSKKNQNMWFRFYQDRNKLAHILTQGILGVSRTFGASDNPKAACTISPQFESINKTS